MFKEFKEFALKGSMVDLAIGIVIGAAFGVVVASLVADIVTPLIAALMNAPDFKNLFVVLRGPSDVVYPTADAARAAGAVVMSYGTFLNAAFSFLLVVLALFVIVKAVNRMRRVKSDAAAVETPPAPTPTEVLLSEIRDLLSTRPV